VPFSFHYQNRKSLCQKLRETINDKYKDDTVLILMGGKEIPVYDTDTKFDDYKQESNFQ